MKNLVILLLLLLAAGAWAQTTVTGTVVDPNGNAYANGTASAYSVASSGQATISISPVPTNSVGAFTMTIPAAGTYIFTICAPPTLANVPATNPSPKQVCFTSQPLIISGGAMDISANLIAVAVVLGPKSGSGGGGSGSVTSVSTNANSAGQPLFSMTVVTPTTTPALNFQLLTAPPNTVYANCSPSNTAVPGFCQITSSMITSALSGSGFISGSLTSPFLPKASGANSLANSQFTDNGTNGLYGGSSFGVGSGDPSCGSATGCYGATGGSTAGSPLAGHGYLRYDSAANRWRVNSNGGAENYAPEFTNIGTAGQIPVCQGDGTCVVTDPLISVNPPILIQNQSLTGTFTTASVPLSLLTTAGSLSYTISGITGSPLTCTLQMLADDGFGNTANNGSTISLTMTNGRHDFNFSSPSIFGSAKAAVTYACAAYPSGGTVTIAEAPFLNVVIQQATGSNLNTNLSQYGGTNAVSAATAGLQPVESRGRNGTSTDIPYPGCDKFAVGSVSASGTSSAILAAPGGNAVNHICSVTFTSASTTAVNAKLVAGTHGAADCDTPGSDLSITVPLQALANSAPVGITISPPNSDWHPTTLNSQVCINLSAAQTVFYQINFTTY